MIAIKIGSASSTIKRTQFPLALAWASTFDKVQGLSLDQGVADFSCGQDKYILYSLG